MAFTFQINNNLEFNHDEILLEKAEKYRPHFYKEKVKAKRIVELVEDETKLNGIWIKESKQKIEKIKECGLKRNDCMILDFKTHHVGTFQIDASQIGSPMDAPLYLRLRFAEMPVELSVESSDYHGWLSRSWIQEEYIHVDELPTTITLPRRYSFRYVELKILDTSPKWQVVFSNPLVITETSANYNRLKPLNLEDKQLQKIYDIGVKTLAECFQDVFEDGPKRDRRLWLGDLRLQALANYATFDQVELVKRCLYLFAAMTTKEGKIPANVFVKPQNMPDDTFLFDYSLFFISTLYDLNYYHPDKEIVEELYPIAKRQMDLALKNVNVQGKLILDESYPVFVDWSNDFNKETAGQGEMIYVLKQFLALAQIVQESQIKYYKKQLDLMVQYAKKVLFQPEKNLFVTKENEFNIASQVWMVLAHVMSDKENKAIMQTTIQQLFPIKNIATPYMYHHIVEALFEAGLKEEAIDLMKNYWGKMITLGADTYWEAFDPAQPHYSPYGSVLVNSYCHAWSCTPVYLIKKYLCKNI